MTSASVVTLTGFRPTERRRANYYPYSYGFWQCRCQCLNKHTHADCLVAVQLHAAALLYYRAAGRMALTSMSNITSTCASSSKAFRGQPSWLVSQVILCCEMYRGYKHEESGQCCSVHADTLPDYRLERAYCRVSVRVSFGATTCHGA